jgi:mRNA interferase MazF
MAARRGEIWRTSFDPIVGHEQAGDRPALIVSDDRMNNSAAGLVIVVPLTKTRRASPSQVEIRPPEGGIRARSYAMCEQVRSVSVDRLRDGPWGPPLSPTLMAEVDRRLRLLLHL